MTVFPCAGGTYHDSHPYAIVARRLPEDGSEPGPFTMVATMGLSSAAISEHIMLRIAAKIRRRLPAGVKVQLAVVFGCPKYYYDLLTAKKDTTIRARGTLYMTVAPESYDIFNFELYTPQGKPRSKVVSATERYIFFSGSSSRDGIVVFSLAGSAESEVMLDILIKSHVHLNPDALVVKRVGVPISSEPVE